MGKPAEHETNLGEATRCEHQNHTGDEKCHRPNGFRFQQVLGEADDPNSQEEHTGGKIILHLLGYASIHKYQGNQRKKDFKNPGFYAPS